VFVLWNQTYICQYSWPIQCTKNYWDAKLASSVQCWTRQNFVTNMKFVLFLQVLYRWWWWFVTTLALCSWSKQRPMYMPKVQPKSHICTPGSVREWTLTLPSGFALWELNPYGVLNIQRGISEVKTHWIKKFFIPLESS
jgi:hypothetical protein